MLLLRTQFWKDSINNRTFYFLLTSPSLEGAVNGWSTLPLVNTSISGGFHVTLQWLNNQATCSMGIPSSLEAQWLLEGQSQTVQGQYGVDFLLPLQTPSIFIVQIKWAFCAFFVHFFLNKKTKNNYILNLGMVAVVKHPIGLRYSIHFSPTASECNKHANFTISAPRLIQSTN